MTKAISFQLLAPNNPEVILLGSWNDWRAQAMRLDDDGYWRTEIPLPDGEYQYIYEVVSCSPALAGRRVQVPDPYALEWTWDDKTLLRVHEGERLYAGYTWQYEDAELPPNEQLIIYELHVGDFSGGEGDFKARGEAGTFHDIINKLDYLADLGINAIELMPVTATPPGFQLGYSQLSYYALNARYGSAHDFAALVDACHARGIRVIHDSVYNHTARDAIWALIDYEYWFYLHNPDDHDFGPKLNYQSLDTRQECNPAQTYVLGSMDLWMREFHLDGMRFDFARALPDDLLQTFDERLKQAATPRSFFTIAECLPENPCIVGPNGALDAAWTQMLMRQVITTALGVPHDNRNPFDVHALQLALDYRVTGYTDAYSVINYLASHDEPHLMYILQGNSNLDADAQFRRAKLAAAILLTVPGIPMLWMGEEFGEYGPKPEGSRPLRWNLLDKPEHRALWETYRRLIQLRKANPALYSRNYRVLMADQNDLVLAYLRWSDDRQQHVLVIANLFDRALADFALDLSTLPHGTWQDALSDATVTIGQDNRQDNGQLHGQPIGNKSTSITLDASQVMVLCHATN